MFWGGTPANNWDLQCREGRILESRISPLQVLGICWGGKNQLRVGGLGPQAGSVRSQLAVAQVGKVLGLAQGDVQGAQPVERSLAP